MLESPVFFFALQITLTQNIISAQLVLILNFGQSQTMERQLNFKFGIQQDKKGFSFLDLRKKKQKEISKKEMKEF